MKDRSLMAKSAFEDDPELHVVRAAEPFETLFHREFPRMVPVACAITGNERAAEELAQEACLRAYQSWRSVSGCDKPGAWLRRVTINLANSFLRRRLSQFRALERYVPNGVEPLSEYPVEERELWEEVKSLPRRRRKVIVLRYVDDFRTSEIADVLDISESSGPTHLQKASPNGLLGDDSRVEDEPAVLSSGESITVHLWISGDLVIFDYRNGDYEAGSYVAIERT